MLGRAVSSRTPSEAQPRPDRYCQSEAESAATKPRTDAGPHIGWPHCAVGTHRARHSETGLPRSCTSAEWMLGFVTPPDVSRSFTVSPNRELELNALNGRRTEPQGFIVGRTSVSRGP